MLTYLVTFRANEEKCENYHQKESKIKIVRMLLFINNKESRNYEVLTTLKR